MKRKRGALIRPTPPTRSVSLFFWILFCLAAGWNSIILASDIPRFPSAAQVCETLLAQANQPKVTMNSEDADHALSLDRGDGKPLAVSLSRSLGPGLSTGDQVYHRRLRYRIFWFKKIGNFRVSYPVEDGSRESSSLDLVTKKAGLRHHRIATQAYQLQKPAREGKGPAQLRNIRIPENARVEFLRELHRMMEPNAPFARDIVTTRQTDRSWVPSVQDKGGRYLANAGTVALVAAVLPLGFWIENFAHSSEYMPYKFSVLLGSLVLAGLGFKFASHRASTEAQTRRLSPDHAFGFFFEQLKNNSRHDLKLLLEGPDHLQVYFVNREKNLDIYFWYPQGIKKTVPMPSVPVAVSSSATSVLDEPEEEIQTDPDIGDLDDTEEDVEHIEEDLEDPEDVDVEELSDAGGDPDQQGDEESFMVEVESLGNELLSRNEAVQFEELKAPSTSGLGEAAERFRDHFQWIGERLVERERALEIAKLSLLSGKNLLMVGPSEEAKSTLARLVLGIPEKPGESNSYFEILMGEETSVGDLFGMPHPGKALDGQRLRNFKEGFLDKRFVFFDELLSPRFGVLNKLFTGINERRFAEAGRVQQGINYVHFAATNTFLTELSNQYDALLARFPFIVYIGSEFEALASAMQLVDGKFDRSRLETDFSYQDISSLSRLVRQVPLPESIQLLVAIATEKMKVDLARRIQKSREGHLSQVQQGDQMAEPPLRSTRIFSSGSRIVAGHILRTIAVDRWIQSDGEVSPHVTPEDLYLLEPIFTTSGPTNGTIGSRLRVAANPAERAQLRTIRLERSLFRTTVRALLSQRASAPWRARLDGLLKREQEGSDIQTLQRDAALLVRDLEKARPDLEETGELLLHLEGGSVAALETFPEAVALLRRVIDRD